MSNQVYQFDIEINRGLVRGEDESPVIIDSPQSKSKTEDQFVITRRMDFAVLPEEGDTQFVDSYLYEPFFNTEGNFNNLDKLIYTDLLLTKHNEGYYVQVDIQNVGNGIEKNRDKNFIVTQKQLDEAFGEEKLLTTKYKTSIFKHQESLILSETKSGYYLLKFDVNYSTGKQTNVLSYVVPAEKTTSPYHTMLNYLDQSSNADECCANKLYYNKINTDITTKYGYYWAFKKDDHYFYPAILDFPENQIISEVGRYGETDLTIEGAHEIKERLKNIKIYPFYFNRAVTIPRGDGVLNKTYYLGLPKDSKGEFRKIEPYEIHKYKYLYNTESEHFDTFISVKDDSGLTAYNWTEKETWYEEMRFLQYYKTNSDKFKFTLQPYWTSDNDANPVGIEVYSECFTGQLSDMKKIPDKDVIFVCQNGKDGSQKITTITELESEKESKTTENSSESTQIDFTTEAYPLKSEDKFTLYCGHYDKSTVDFVKLTVTPLMIYGKLEQFSREIILDCSKIMTGACDFTNWSYYYRSNAGKNTIELTYGYNLYLSDTMYVSEAHIDFYNIKYYINGGSLNIPQNFTSKKPSYRFDILEKTASSGVYSDVLLLDQKEDSLKSNNLYLCRIFIKVSIGSTYINHTLFRYLYTTDVFNRYYDSTFDFNELNLKFDEIARISIDPGWDTCYTTELPFKEFQEVYTKTKVSESKLESHTLDQNEIKTSHEFKLEALNKSIWEISEGITMTGRAYFIDGITGQEITNNPKIEFKYEQRPLNTSTSDQIKLDFWCESLLSHSYRWSQPSGVSYMFNIEYAGGSGARINGATTATPILNGDKSKCDSMHYIGSANATESAAGLVIYTTGFYEKNVGNRSSYNFQEILQDSSNHCNWYNANMFRPVFLLGKHLGKHRSDIQSHEYIDVFHNTGNLYNQIQCSINWATVDNVGQNLRAQDLTNNYILGQYIAHVRGIPHQTNVYFLTGRGGKNIFLRPNKAQVESDYYTIGDMIATKLGQYYIFDAGQKDIINNLKPTGEDWYENIYEMSETFINIKKEIGFNEVNGYVFSGYESEDKYFYFNINDLIKFKDLQLNLLKNAIDALPEVKNSPNPIKHNNIQFTENKYTDSLNHTRSYTFKIKDPSLIIDNFIRTHKSNNLYVGAFISPRGDVTYRGISKDNYENNYDGSSHKFFVWPAFSDKPQLLKKKTVYHNLAYLGKPTTKKLGNGVEVVILDIAENPGFDNKNSIKPAFSRFRNSTQEGFYAADWEDLSLRGNLYLKHIVSDEEALTQPLYALADDEYQNF